MSIDNNNLFKPNIHDQNKELPGRGANVMIFFSP